MRKKHIRAHHLFASWLTQGFQIGWKKVIGVIVIVGAMMGGLPGTAQAMTPALSQGFYGDASLAAPKLQQSAAGPFSSKYLSAHVERNVSSGQQLKLSGTAAATVTRCPAFSSWEDWGGARVHASVAFAASDLCNGRHVKAAYVRLIRQCGPYYDTGRIYTDTASSTSDTQMRGVSVWIFDSPIWWCNTNTYYGYDYF